ncbi:MAG: hypothetical protein K2X47_11615 [Bdellovibrionales bacterium]|nr:hypothetical protein [Bdellovibrionales bacterium]
MIRNLITVLGMLIAPSIAFGTQNYPENINDGQNHAAKIPGWKNTQIPDNVAANAEVCPECDTAIALTLGDRNTTYRKGSSGGTGNTGGGLSEEGN